MENTSKGTFPVSLVNAGFISAGGVQNLFPLSNMIIRIRGSVSPSSSVSHHMSTWQPWGSHSLPNDILSLTVDTWRIWVSNWHCRSARCRMRWWVWFLAISALLLQKIRVSFREHIELFRSFIQHLHWNSNSWAQLFHLADYSITLEEIRQYHHICICKKYSYAYIHSLPAPSFI